MINNWEKITICTRKNYRGNPCVRSFLCNRYLFVCLFVCLVVCLFGCLFVCLFVSLSLSRSLSLSLSVSLSLYLSLSLPIYFFLLANLDGTVFTSGFRGQQKQATHAAGHARRRSHCLDYGTISFSIGSEMHFRRPSEVQSRAPFAWARGCTSVGRSKCMSDPSRKMKV